jgi:hypothetical protein
MEEIRLKATEKEIVSMIKSIFDKDVVTRTDKDLEYEDIAGNGVCREDGDLHGVGDCCSMYKPDIKTEERTTHDRNNR